LIFSAPQARFFVSYRSWLSVSRTTNRESVSGPKSSELLTYLLVWHVQRVMTYLLISVTCQKPYCFTHCAQDVFRCREVVHTEPLCVLPRRGLIWLGLWSCCRRWSWCRVAIPLEPHCWWCDARALAVQLKLLHNRHLAVKDNLLRCAFDIASGNTTRGEIEKCSEPSSLYLCMTSLIDLSAKQE
jgi:hypothetical protein